MIALALAISALAGCAPTTESGPKVIDGGFPPRGDLPALPFRIADQTGKIRAVTITNDGGVMEGVSQVPERDDALYVHWIGGQCDRRVLVIFEQSVDGPAFTIDTERDFGGCRMVGIPRILMIELTGPVDASTVSLSMKN